MRSPNKSRETKLFDHLGRWVSMNGLAFLLGVSKRTIRRWVAEGRLPAPHRFTRRTVRWDQADLWPLLVQRRVYRRGEK